MLPPVARGPRRVGAVVLAAGASIRMGAPKALVHWRGRSFVGNVVDRAVAAGCAPVVVVQGAHPIAVDEIAPATIRINPRWSEGPTTSLQAGLGGLAGLDAVVIATIDRPHLALATWQALLAAHAREPEAVWQPRYGTKRGHPLLFPAWLLPRVLQLAPTQTLHELLASPEVAAARRVFDVEDPAVLDNIDSPDDLARLPA